MAKNIKTPAAPELDTEVANRLSDPFEVNYLGVLRTNDPLLLERGGNGSAAYEAYRDLKRDGKVFAWLQKRKLAVISRPWQVEPVADTPKGKQDAKTVSDILKALNFDQMCSDLLDALLMGWAPMEIVWTVRGGLVVPSRVIKRAQRRFVYLQAGEHVAPELRLLTQANMLTGEALPARKFIVHQVNAEDDNPYGMGLGLQLFWPVFFKRKGIIAWNKLNDRFGVPDNVWDEGGGARTLEYNRQPAGQRNYMITIGPDGKMSALRQVLTPQNFALITPGMDLGEVRRRLGRPAKVTPYALSGETHHDWRFLEPPQERKMFTVISTDGRTVARTQVGPDMDAPEHGGR